MRLIKTHWDSLRLIEIPWESLRLLFELSRQADFKTPIGCQIWSRFHREKGQKLVSHSKGGVLYDSRDPQCTFVHFPFSNMVLFHELSPVNILQTRNHRFVVLPSSVMSIIRHKGRVHSKKKKLSIFQTLVWTHLS